MGDVVFPAIIGGRRVRCHTVDTGRGVVVHVLEAADADAVIDDVLATDGDPYAAILWPSAIAAATRLPDLLHPGAHVLDLGAGTGLVALAAARLGARVSAADHDAFARTVIAEAAALNGVHVAVSDFDVAGEEPLPPADLLVMADLLYEPALARAAAARTLEALEAGCTVLVADPARFGRAEYQRLLAKAGLDTVFDDVVVPVPGEAEPARTGVCVLRPSALL